MDEPRVYVSIERKFNLGGYEHEVVTLGVSQLPFNASDDEIDYALDTAQLTVEKIRDALRGRIAHIRREEHVQEQPKRNVSALEPEIRRCAICSEPQVLTTDGWTCRNCHESAPVAAEEDDLDTNPDAEQCGGGPDSRGDALLSVEGDRAEGEKTIGEHLREKFVAEHPEEYDPFDELEDDAPAKIMQIDPAASTFAWAESDWDCPTCGAHCFKAQRACACGYDRVASGLPIAIPRDDEIETHGRTLGVEIPFPPEDWASEGLSGPQLTACNAGLTNIGYGGKARHKAALAILEGFYGEVARESLTTMRDLSKAEAHVVLTWLNEATGEAKGELAELMKAPELPLVPLLEQSIAKVQAEKDARRLAEARDLYPEEAEAATDEPQQILSEAELAQAEEGMYRLRASIASHRENKPEGEPEEEHENTLGVVNDDVELSEEQQAAIDLVMERIKAKSGGVVFITGKAGTGKSTVLREIKRRARVCVCAPTGLAAINVGGMTIHRFFGLKVGPVHRRSVTAIKSIDRARVLAEAEAVVFDEISMVRADVFDGVDKCMQSTLGVKKPFGGKLVVVIGDMLQLEPVVIDRPDASGKSEKDWLESRYRSPFWFDAHVFRAPTQTTIEDIEEVARIDIEVVELTQIFRQVGNPEFVDALNAIRVGDPGGIDYLNRRVGIEPPAGTLPVVLTFTNKKAEAINTMRLSGLSTESRTYTARMTGDFSEKEIPAPLELELKVGAQVMILKNVPFNPYFEHEESEDSYERLEDYRRFEDVEMLANGTVGKIVGFLDRGPIVELRDGRKMVAEAAQWDKISYAFDLKEDKITEQVEGQFTQVPLKLAWAITTHKSQGQTLESAVLEMESAAFAHGQLYVALSRVKNLDGLYLKRALTKKDLTLNERVREFCNIPDYSAPKAGNRAVLA